MPSPKHQVTLQLWIDNRLYVEKHYNIPITVWDISRHANFLFDAHKITIGRKPWYIVWVRVQSKMNCNLQQYAREEVEKSEEVE